jgi:hypothetical protein
MGEFLLVLLLVVVVLAGACVATVILLVHALHVRNRVAPGRRSSAPLSWLAAPDLAARLHRRLRLAVAMVTNAIGPAGADLGLADVADQLVERAVQLDDQLVLASRAPKPARRRMLRELQSEVTELERLAERTVRMSRAWAGANPSERGLGPIRERLELLEAALRELDGVEVHRPFSPPEPLRRSRELG